MPTKNHVEKMRFEVGFPEKGRSGSGATIYMHISVIQFFKKLTSNEIKNVRKYLVVAGEEYFGDQAKIYCRVTIDAKYGLMSWDCPGDACGFNSVHGEFDHMEKEDKEWIEYNTHNCDNTEQLIYLLAAACFFRDTVEALS